MKINFSLLDEPKEVNLVPVQDVGSVQKAITEGTNGRAGIEKDQELYYAVIDGKVITFDH